LALLAAMKPARVLDKLFAIFQVATTPLMPASKVNKCLVSHAGMGANWIISCANASNNPP
jgi:hypothetical protein